MALQLKFVKINVTLDYYVAILYLQKLQMTSIL